MLPSKFYLDSIFDDFMDTKEPMKCDIYEKDGIVHIEADMPGMKKEDIKVELNDGYLTIGATKEENSEEKDKNFIKKERFYGKLERKFYIGDVNEDEVNAEFTDGVLKIQVPKEDKEKNKKTIDVK